jgi:hypothetical protein
VKRKDAWKKICRRENKYQGLKQSRRKIRRLNIGQKEEGKKKRKRKMKDEGSRKEEKKIKKGW